MNTNDKISRIDETVQLVFAEKAAKIKVKLAEKAVREEKRQLRKLKIAKFAEHFTRAKKNVEATVTETVTDITESIKEGVAQGLNAKTEQVETVIAEIVT